VSNRTRYSIIKGITPNDAKDVIAEAIRAMPGPKPSDSRWSDWQQVVKMREYTASICEGGLIIVDDAWKVAHEIGRLRNSPRLELRVQEGDHWDFTTFYRGEVVADFSTRVGYFGPDPTTPRPWKMGDARAFCNCWSLPLERVQPYLIDWDSHSTGKLAQDGDNWPNGDWRQIFDFMRILKVADPSNHPGQFKFNAQGWGSAYIRQPWWRRAVRSISVWFKGTYPDVPALTNEEREESRIRRENTCVVRVDLEKLLEEHKDDEHD
jgi:hypothetical protein